jgi:hypothetical protein
VLGPLPPQALFETVERALSVKGVAPAPELALRDRFYRSAIGLIADASRVLPGFPFRKSIGSTRGVSGGAFILLAEPACRSITLSFEPQAALTQQQQQAQQKQQAASASAGPLPQRPPFNCDPGAVVGLVTLRIAYACRPVREELLAQEQWTLQQASLVMARKADAEDAAKASAGASAGVGARVGSVAGSSAGGSAASASGDCGSSAAGSARGKGRGAAAAPKSAKPAAKPAVGKAQRR